MIETLLPAGPPTEEDLALADSPTRLAQQSSGLHLTGLWIQALMLFSAIAAIGYTDAVGAGPYLHHIWIAVAAIFAASCTWDGWGRARSRHDRAQLLTTQLLHWSIFIGATYFVLLPVVHGVLADNSEGLAVLAMLAFGTLIAGIHAWSWRVCAVGLFLTAAVPAVAWINETGMLILLAGFATSALLLSSWLVYRWSRRRDVWASGI